eukprot:3921503-Lingulodinium_polyedra.AAC.1
MMRDEVREVGGLCRALVARQGRTPLAGRHGATPIWDRATTTAVALELRAELSGTCQVRPCRATAT